MRQDVEFQSGGIACRGWFFLPDNLPADRLPAIAMAHGFTGVKEQGLPDYAERFASAGLAVLLFDYRYFGASDGTPRSQIFPADMVEDYKNAVTWLTERDEVNADRIGLWGTSFSGGLVTFVSTFDTRIKAAVAQIPFLLNAADRKALDGERWYKSDELLVRDRLHRTRTGEASYMPAVTDRGGPAVLPQPEAYAFLTGYDAPNWRNQVSLESLERIREFDPTSLIHIMEGTAYLVIAGSRDELIPVERVKTAYERAGSEIKQLIEYDVTHFDVYQDPWLSRSSDDAANWFQAHL